MGFSLGANVVLKMLGEDGDASPFAGACLCSPPIDLISMSNHLENNWIGKFCDNILVRGCNRLFDSEPMLKRLLGVSSTSSPSVQKPASMLELDGRVIAPMFGFSCASEYYRSASSGPYLSRVRRPTLVVHCANDPIVAVI